MLFIRYDRQRSSSSFIETEYHVFMLANPKSGSQEATKYTGLDFVNCTIPLTRGKHVVLHVYNLTNSAERNRCFKKMAKL